MKTTFKITVTEDDAAKRRNALSYAINCSTRGHLQSVTRNDEKGTATVVIIDDDEEHPF